MTFWIGLSAMLAVVFGIIWHLAGRERRHFAAARATLTGESGDPIDRLATFATELALAKKYADRNRSALLAIHGLGGVATTLLMMIHEPYDGTARLLSQWAETFDSLPALGGILLLAGLAWNRNLVLEALGMVCLLLWDLGMMRIFQHDLVGGQVSYSYPLAIYGTLAGLMILHLASLFGVAAETRRTK